MPEKTIADAIHDAIHDEMARDPSVVVMGEDVGYKGGVFKITDGLQQEFGMYRAFDTPIAEVGIAGIAIGAAFSGLKPIAEMQFADYSLPAYDQIVNEAACIRYRSNGDWGCPVVFRSPFGAVQRFANLYRNFPYHLGVGFLGQRAALDQEVAHARHGIVLLQFVAHLVGAVAVIVV